MLKVKKPIKPLNWDPVRRGDVYCSSACGGGCTWAAYQKAKREAEAMCRQWPGFKPRIWENLGWHWEIVNDDSVFIKHASTHWYFAGVGLGIIGEGRTPRAALKKAMLKMQSDAQFAMNKFTALRQVLKRK